MPIHIVIQDADVVLNQFTTLIRKLDNPRSALEDVRKDFFDVERRWFSSEGEGTWAPLSASTLRSKPRGDGILVRTGALRASLTQAGARYGYNRINRATLFLGTTHPAASFHELGAPRANLPRRELIGVSERDTERWSKLIASRIAED